MSSPETASPTRENLKLEVENLTAHLEQEAQQLREQIATATNRLQEIEMFLKLAAQFTARYQTDRELASVLIDSRMRHQVTQRDRIVSATAQILRDGVNKGVRELRRDLEALGIRIGGADPNQTLSTYLSRDPKFRSRNTEDGWVWYLSPAMASGAPRDWLESMRNRLAHGSQVPLHRDEG